MTPKATGIPAHGRGPSTDGQAATPDQETIQVTPAEQFSLTQAERFACGLESEQRSDTVIRSLEQLKNACMAAGDPYDVHDVEKILQLHRLALARLKGFVRRIGEGR